MKNYVITKINEFELVQTSDTAEKGKGYPYEVINTYIPNDYVVKFWGEEDLSDMSIEEKVKTNVWKTFIEEIRYKSNRPIPSESDIISKATHGKRVQKISQLDLWGNEIQTYNDITGEWEDNIPDTYTDETPDNMKMEKPVAKNWWEKQDHFHFSGNDYHYTPSYSKIDISKYTKSDTLVFHATDSSTTELAQIYKGRGWDVVHETNLDPNDSKALIEAHKRIICLGHGTSWGLMGGNITEKEAPLLENKELFVIWCNADKYFENHHIGNGYFITGNMPSERGESLGAGCGDIGQQEMKDNITDWNRMLADHLDELLKGGASARKAVEEVRKEYIDKWGYHKVTIYNAERTKLQGDPQPDLSKEFWGDDEKRCAKSAIFQKYHPGKKNIEDAFPSRSSYWGSSDSQPSSTRPGYNKADNSYDDRNDTEDTISAQNKLGVVFKTVLLQPKKNVYLTEFNKNTQLYVSADDFINTLRRQHFQNEEDEKAIRALLPGGKLIIKPYNTAANMKVECRSMHTLEISGFTLYATDKEVYYTGTDSSGKASHSFYKLSKDSYRLQAIYEMIAYTPSLDQI